MPKAKSFETVFIFLDTDKFASPFDILFTIDVLQNVHILKYEDVNPENVEKIVHDAMFPRGPEGAKHTKLFLNGTDLDKLNNVLEKIRNSMFTPFELAVIVDPRGAYTTAAATVAKTLHVLRKKGSGKVEGKSVTILAGTGLVGKTAAKLFVHEGLKVIITSRKMEKSSEIASAVNAECGVEIVRGVRAATPEEIGNAISGSEIILSTGAAGTTLLTKRILSDYAKNCKVVADVNAIPPPGVEGLNVDADQTQLAKNILGIGALTIGTFKNRVEAILIGKVAEESKGIFDYRAAYELAKRIIDEKPDKETRLGAESSKAWLP